MLNIFVFITEDDDLLPKKAIYADTLSKVKIKEVADC
jgi:hypothetical protein